MNRHLLVESHRPQKRDLLTLMWEGGSKYGTWIKTLPFASLWTALRERASPSHLHAWDC